MPNGTEIKCWVGSNSNWGVGMEKG